MSFVIPCLGNVTDPLPHTLQAAELEGRGLLKFDLAAEILQLKSLSFSSKEDGVARFILSSSQLITFGHPNLIWMAFKEDNLVLKLFLPFLFPSPKEPAQLQRS